MTISSEPKDKTKIWKLKTGFGNIEMMTAGYYKQSFAKHSHNDFPIGIIEKGAMSFYFRRNNLITEKEPSICPIRVKFIMGNLLIRKDGIIACSILI